MEPLQELAGPLPTGEIARAAARAVEAIQSRLEGAAPGQLSLVTGGDEGGLSLAADRQQGELSLPPPDDGSAKD